MDPKYPNLISDSSSEVGQKYGDEVMPEETAQQLDDQFTNIRYNKHIKSNKS